TWEQRKLGDFFKESDEKNASLEFGVERTISVASMRWNPAGNGAAKESLSGYKILRLGDLAFEGNRTKGNPYGKLVINDIGPGIMSSRFRTMSAISSPCIGFWKYYLTVDGVFRKIYINSTKRGTLMTELVVDELLSNSVKVPPSSEQACIGALFSKLDSLITLHQRE
ncbi:restriction endonuclease subunit S domain-containing protein, partial [Adlercreutzia shanghongiae]